MHVHILGICGTLMGSIALLARELGFEVSGSDENVYPPMSDQLAEAGIDLAVGYKASNIPDDVDLVMIGNAGLPRGNEAVEYVLDKGLPYTSGAEWLGRYLLADRWVIALAGTHGKTTTTSMVAWILEYAGMAPGFLIGGIPGNFDASARLGETPFFVIEADEYDTSYFDRRSKFLHYHPRTLVLNNLEYDHADIFPDLEAIQNQFHLLLRTIPSSGLIIHPAQDDNLEAVFQRGCWTPRLVIDNNGDGTADGADFGVRLLKEDGSAFTVIVKGHDVGIVEWSLSGAHNVSNGLAALAAARHVGVEPAIGCEALSQFEGVKRRLEIIYQQDGLTVYDDFAHHPTAIETTLAGLRARAGSEKILAIIEPRSHTMKNGTHADRLAAATRDADQVIWYKPENVAWQIQDLANADTRVIDQVETILDAAIAAANEGVAHIVLMSNGGFFGLHRNLVNMLRTRERA